MFVLLTQVLVAPYNVFGHRRGFCLSNDDGRKPMYTTVPHVTNDNTKNAKYWLKGKPNEFVFVLLLLTLVKDQEYKVLLTYNKINRSVLRTLINDLPRSFFVKLVTAKNL